MTSYPPLVKYSPLANVLTFFLFLHSLFFLPLLTFSPLDTSYFSPNQLVCPRISPLSPRPRHTRCPRPNKPQELDAHGVQEPCNARNSITHLKASQDSHLRYVSYSYFLSTLPFRLFDPIHPSVHETTRSPTSKGTNRSATSGMRSTNSWT